MQLLWKSTCWLLWKVKDGIIIWSSNSTSEYKLKRIERKVLKRYWNMHVIAALFSTAKRWRHPKVHWQMTQQTKCSVYTYSRIFSSVTQSCPTLCNPMNCSTSGFPVHHQLLEFTQTHVHRVGDAIQPSHPLSSPFPPAPNPSHHQSLFQWVNPVHEVAKVLEFQLQHQYFQRNPRADLL